MSANKILIIGLTGSIGMGKTVVASQLATLGGAVCDSDKLVHALLGPKGAAVEAVGALFPATRKGNAIDRAALGKEVFGHKEKLAKLEVVLHPLVRKGQDRFIRRARILGKRFVVLDIPLLFETGGEKRCDATVVASAPSFLQRRRVLARSGMTEEKFARILAHQMPDSKKRILADYVVHTGLGRAVSLREVKRIVGLLSA